MTKSTTKLTTQQTQIIDAIKQGDMSEVMYQFTNGATCWKDSENLKLVINDLEVGKFEISGFEDIADMDNFASCGEFSERNNKFFKLTKSKLIWKYFD